MNVLGENFIFMKKEDISFEKGTYGNLT